MTLIQRALWQSGLQYSAAFRREGVSYRRTLLRPSRGSEVSLKATRRCVTSCSLSIPGDISSSSEEARARPRLPPTVGPDRAEGKREGLKLRAHGGSRSSGQFDKDDGLPATMFVPFHNLPPDGRAIAEEEESCNPEEKRCRTPVYVWESRCKACFGSGQVTSRSRRGRSTYTCIACLGIGYVRKSSARMIPDLTDGTGNLTLGRSNGVTHTLQPGQDGSSRGK